MMRKTMVVAAFAALLASGAASAQQPGPRPGGNGAEGRDRMGPPRGRPDPARMFAAIDANHDGSISRAEFMAYRPGRGPDGRGPGGPGGPGRDGRGPEGRAPEGGHGAQPRR